eukprot:1203294-Pleurochrysis_carterae.AAC.6
MREEPEIEEESGRGERENVRGREREGAREGGREGGGERERESERAREATIEVMKCRGRGDFEE